MQVAPDDGNLDYAICNPDRSALLDPIDASKPYSGQLWQSGHHVVEIINRRHREAGYSVTLEVR